MIDFEMNNFLDYNFIAMQAAASEIEYRYEAAAFLWGKAASLAKKQDNRNWALARKEFCESPKRYNLY